MRLLMILLAMICLCPSMRAQSLSDMDKIMAFLGSDDLVEVASEEVERLENLLAHPIRLNCVSEAVLRSCGLFSAYQVAVIEDYISPHGPIKSLLEFSMLDGMGNDFAYKVAPFIDLQTEKLSDSSYSKHLRHDMAVKGSYILREGNDSDGSYGLKLRVDSPGKFTSSFAVSRASGGSSWSPSSISGSLAWQMKRIPLRLTIGDYYARFGQGLVLWSSSFMSNLTSPEAFMKKPSGITQPWSFAGSSAMTGLAAEFDCNKIKLSYIASLFDSKTALNIAWFGKIGQISLTNVVDFAWKSNNSMVNVITGLDAAFCIRGVNLFGEMSYNWSSRVPSLVTGSRFGAGDHIDIAVQLRALERNEYGAALSGAFKFGTRLPSAGTLSLDVVHYPESKEEGEPYSLQMKSQLNWEMSLSETWKIKFRLSERLRTWGFAFRTDVRSDISYSFQPFIVNMRVNFLNCDKTGFLSYLEGGYNGEKISLYLRQGVFFIDDWDDRIYVYERDAPSSFNVPAMYGRGVWTALTSSWKTTSRLKIYARASFTAYPFMTKKKPGKAELKLQLQYRF